MRKGHIFAGLGLSACLLLPSFAAQTPLRMRPGLWEMTVTSRTATLDPAVLDKMTPPQREMAQTRFAAALAKLPPHDYKDCITQRGLDRGLNLTPHAERQCTRTVLFSSSTNLEGHEECKGEETRSADFHFEVTNPVKVQVTYDAVIGSDSKIASSRIIMEGRWLGTDCAGLTPQ